MSLPSRKRAWGGADRPHDRLFCFLVFSIFFCSWVGRTETETENQTQKRNKGSVTFHAVREISCSAGPPGGCRGVAQATKLQRTPNPSLTSATPEQLDREDRTKSFQRTRHDREARPAHVAHAHAHASPANLPPLDEGVSERLLFFVRSLDALHGRSANAPLC